MKCSAYIATSVDGFIAKKDDTINWLHTAGNGTIITGADADMGFHNYLASVDCMIMGRKCMEVISSMNLTSEQWPYGNLKIIVLSTTLKTPPANLKDKITLYSGDLLTLVSNLKNEGYKHAYIDGGTTIQAFINLKLLHGITITKAPILLGEGKPLFGKIFKDIRLEQAQAIAFPNDFIQLKYILNYN